MMNHLVGFVVAVAWIVLTTALGYAFNRFVVCGLHRHEKRNDLTPEQFWFGVMKPDEPLGWIITFLTGFLCEGAGCMIVVALVSIFHLLGHLGEFVMKALGV